MSLINGNCQKSSDIINEWSLIIVSYSIISIFFWENNNFEFASSNCGTITTWKEILYLLPTRKKYIILGIFYHCRKLLWIFLKFQTKFDKDAVRDIIRYAIKENVGTSQQYDKTLITTWSNELMEACLVALTKLQKPFKYIGMILKYAL